ncbi:MAG: murein biosynthesis integral membrane protein MurJ [Phycisphaerales bacterium]|nr:murein biosynthesis integral membrane protein MurJ [Phycisphaerales bacterium]
MSRSHESFVGHAWTVTLFTLLSRIVGLLRDGVISAVLGTSGIASSFVTALIVPNVFRRLFGEGALSAAFIPEYTKLSDTDRREAGRYASVVMAMLLVTLGSIVVVAEVVLFVLLEFAGGGSNGRGDFLTLTMIMLPYMPLVCATAIAGGMLQAHGKFVPHAAAPVLLNVCMIVAALVWAYVLDASMRATAVAVAVAVVGAGVVQLGWCVWSMRREAYWTRRFGEARGRAWDTVKRMGPAAIGLGALQVSTLFDALLAGWPVMVGATIAGYAFPMDDGSAATLYYAQRLYQFPLGVFGIAIATAIFPLLSRCAGSAEDFAQVLRRGVRLSLFIGIPAAAGLVLVRDDLVGAVYLRGKFDAEDVPRVGMALACFAPAVWAYALTHVLTRAFYAKGDTVTPMRMGLATVGCNITLNLVLMWFLRESGLALATAITAMMQSVVLMMIAGRRFRDGGAILDRATARGIGASVLSAAVMALAIWGVRQMWEGGGGDWRGHARSLGVDVAVGLAVYLGIAVVWKRAEWRMLIGGLTRRGGDVKDSAADTPE